MSAGGSRIGSRLYLIEKRTAHSAQSETWATHEVHTDLAKATKSCRKRAGEGGSYRVAEYVYNRVAITVHNVAVRR